MNILFVNSQKVDEFGGGEQWVITTGLGLRDRRHRVWICGRPESRLLESARMADLDALPLRFPGDSDPSRQWKVHRFLQSVAITRLLDDPTLARSVADAARARVMRDFTVGAMVDGVESLFERMVT